MLSASIHSLRAALHSCLRWVDFSVHLILWSACVRASCKTGDLKYVQGAVHTVDLWQCKIPFGFTTQFDLTYNADGCQQYWLNKYVKLFIKNFHIAIKGMEHLDC